MQRKQKPKSIKGIFPKDLEGSEIRNELTKIKKYGREVNS